MLMVVLMMLMLTATCMFVMMILFCHIVMFL